MPIDYAYRPVTLPGERDALFFRMRDEGLLPWAMYALARPGLRHWRRLTQPRQGLLLVCEASTAATPPARGTALGDSAAPPLTDTRAIRAMGLFSGWRGRVAEFDFTVFRPHFSEAVPMALGAFHWMFSHTRVSAIMGLCPASNRHAWRLATACGFRLLARLPQACHLARRHCHVDGMLVCCTPDSLKNAAHSAGRKGGQPATRTPLSSATITPREDIMGFGGSSTPSVPAVTPAPKQEVQKPVTEAATAARQSQKDKAAKAAGIRGSIYTDPLRRQSETNGKTLLGQ